MKCSTCAGSKSVWEKAIAETENPRHREMLRIALRHWWSEVVYDIDTLMSTLTSDCHYRLYGTDAFAQPLVIDTREQARIVYLSQFEAGLMPGGPLDDLRFACGDWGVMFDCISTQAYPGAVLNLPRQKLDSDQLYLMQFNMSVTVPFRGDLLAGEIMYTSSPFNIAKTDRDEIAALLGWYPRNYKR